MVNCLQPPLPSNPTRVLRNPQNRYTPRILGWMARSGTTDKLANFHLFSMMLKSGATWRDVSKTKYPIQPVRGTDGTDSGSGTALVLAVLLGSARNSSIVTARLEFLFHFDKSLLFCRALTLMSPRY
uniref:(northern house mosquito) hypothetical protein n=1 Tax=Culex pipiens TaxID=7175 RepID=A0A8D8G5X6_CULPI